MRNIMSPPRIVDPAKIAINRRLVKPAWLEARDSPTAPSAVTSTPTMMALSATMTKRLVRSTFAGARMLGAVAAER